jgi:antitoxin component of RelBE/YafQ-DinJ toxin-antitoxin module
MARPRTKAAEPTHVGGIYEPQLVAAFDYLCKSMGVSRQEALRRLIIQAIREKKIPGVVPFDFSYEENADAPFKHTKPSSIEIEAGYESPK